MMSVMNNIWKVCPYLFGLVFGISLFIFGIFRISMGISSVRMTDAYTAHVMNVGLLYVNISLLILIAITVMITYSLVKHEE